MRTKRVSRKSEDSKQCKLATISRKKEQKRSTLNNNVKTEENTSGCSSENEPSTVDSHAWVYISAPSSTDDSFSEGAVDKMQNLPKTAGKWMVFNNEEDEEPCSLTDTSPHDFAWKVVKDLVRDYRNTAIIAAKASTLNAQPQGIVCCYTANYKDSVEVKKAADSIRSLYKYPSIMYYKPENENLRLFHDQNGDKVVTLYKHTTENEFYARQKIGPNLIWQITHADEKKPIDESSLPSAVTSHPWLCMALVPRNNGNIKVYAADEMEDLPGKAGKWLLFNNATYVCAHVRMSHHDHAWLSLKSLIRDSNNNQIIAMKCSTNARNPYGQPNKGVICCYTADYNKKAEVKKAADAIRNVYSYASPMYYKTEEDSEAKVCSQRGDRQVSIYRHDSNNGFFERDIRNKGEWVQIHI